MSIRTAVAWSLLGIGVVFAGSVVAIVRLERLPEAQVVPAPPPSPAAPVAPPPAAPAPPAALQTPAQAAAVEAVVPEPVERVVQVRPRPGAAAPPQEATRFRQGIPPARRKVMSSMRAELIAGLEGLQGRVAPCGASDIAFLLTLQSEEDGVHVVDAAVGSPEAGQEAAITCARGAVIGQVMPGHSVEPGKRWQMSFTPLQ